MSLLIVNTESDLLIELQVTEFVAELLKLQCERLTEEASCKAFGTRFGQHFGAALGESVDWDLRAPTPAQIAYATGIAKALGVGLPSEVLRYRGPINEFLDTHNHAYKQRSIARLAEK